MADFEDEANSASLNGLRDDVAAHDPSLVFDQSLPTKFSDPNTQFDPFAPPSSAGMAHNDPRPQHIYQDEEDEEDYPPANDVVSGEYGYHGEEDADDLPANFAREAARNQGYPDEHYGDGASDVDPVGGSHGRGDEADDIAQPGNGSNPFADDVNQGVSAGGYADTDDRPIMGYNPFLNDDRGGGLDGVGAGDANHEGSRENDRFYREDDGHYGADQGQGHQHQEEGDAFDDDQQRGITPGYNRLEEDEDGEEADLEMDPVENIRREEEVDDVYQRPQAVGCHLYGDGERRETGYEEVEDREEQPAGETYPPHGDGSDRLAGDRESEEEEGEKLDEQTHAYNREEDAYDREEDGEKVDEQTHSYNREEDAYDREEDGEQLDDKTHAYDREGDPYERPEAVGCTIYSDPNERHVYDSQEVERDFEENEQPAAVNSQLFGAPEDDDRQKPIAIKCAIFGPSSEEGEDEEFRGEPPGGPSSHEEYHREGVEFEERENNSEQQDAAHSTGPPEAGFETRESGQFEEYQGQPSGEAGNADSQDEQEYEEGLQGKEPAQQRAKEVEEDLGIVNQAFSDDADVEERRGIDEEEEEFEDRKPVESDRVRDEDGYEKEVDAGREGEREEEKCTDEHLKEVEEDNIASHDAAPSESVPKSDHREYEEEEDDAVTEKYKEVSRFEGEQEEEDRETENINNKEREATEQYDEFSKGDDSRDNLSEEEDDIRKEQIDAYDRGFDSRFQDSDTISSQQGDRSFVDNLSELTSPDTIPQPLPSPPEPRETMSPFDPTAPSDSPSPCHENVGQHSEFTQHAGTVDNTGDFLTAGEVEGETKFGVDGTAITSTTERNGAFLNSEEDDEEDETEEESQQLDQGCVTATGTTETETSVDDKSGEYSGHGFEPTAMENNALMSMSMEGSFYDDGGELIGGEDRRGQENHFDQEEENYEQHSLELNEHIQNGFNHEKFQQQQPSHDAFGLHEDDQSSFDPLHDTSAAPRGVGVDSLLDAPVTAQGLQTPVTEQGSTVDSSVDNIGIVTIAGDSHSSVDAAPPAGEPEEPEHEAPGESSIDAVGISSPPEGAIEDHKDLEEALGSIQISEPVSEKAEEPSSSVDEPPPAPKAEDALAAASAPAAAGVVAAAAAAAAGVAVAKSTTTVKKSTTAKASGKTATTTTTTKVVKETKTTNGRPASTKKTEVTTTTTTATTKAAAPKKTDSRPTSVTTTERKTSAKTTATSPTKSTSPAAPKSAGPVPSYAQPITPRKPREAKPASPEEKKKTPTPRTPSATARAPKTTSATTAAAATTTTASAVSSTITKTTVRTTSATATSARTAQLARPKSSPTKLSNGTAGAPGTATDNNKSPTKKSTDAKPGSGSLKITHEKKEIKVTSRIDSGTKTTPTTALRSPTKPASPRVPSATSTPKTGEVKSKVGSLDKTNHTPGGGNVKIQHKKTEYANVTSKIGSKDKIDHKPGGGNVRIETKKLKIEAKSKIGSLENASHKPAGGDKKIEVQKTEWKAQSKVGSLDNAKHKPGGGDKQIESRKLDFKEKASPKIGSAKVSSNGSAEAPATEAPAINGGTSDN